MNAADYLLGAEALAKHGARVALLCGDEAVTYTELAGRVRRSAAAFGAAGVRPGERVLLLMRDTPEFAAAWLGALRAGAVVVSLNSRLTDAEYRHIRAESAARLLLVEEGMPPIFSSSTSVAGMPGAAAVTITLSKGACSGKPRFPSP